MNDLSWLIYFADVAGSMGWAFNFIFIISSIVFVLNCTLGFTHAEEKATKEAWSLWRKFLWNSLIIGFVSFILTGIIPSKNTIYAIAASEMGEEIVKSETAGKAVKALDNWLDKQIDEPKQGDEL